VSTPQSVIFDFDYTLADSSAGVFACVNTPLTEMGFPNASRAQSDATIGLPLVETFSRLTGFCDGDRGTEFADRFHRHAELVMVDSTRMFEFVPEVLSEIASRGAALGVASTKGRKHIEEILEREKLRDAFGAIIGGNDVANQKPDPEALFTALMRLRGDPSTALYVGDSVIDAEAAQRAGVAFVAVLTGVTERPAFDRFPVAAVLEDASELPSWIDRMAR
jgi:phosphoglycolate phosphatase